MKIYKGLVKLLVVRWSGVGLTSSCRHRISLEVDCFEWLELASYVSF